MPEEKRERSPESWSPAKRVSFRFVFAYVVLSWFPVPYALLPGTAWIQSVREKAVERATLWFGQVVLRISQPIATGNFNSSDSLINYIGVLFFAVLALIVTIGWTLLDRRSRAYPKLYDFLRVYVRFEVANLMLAYGVIKLFKGQFGAPRLDTLTAPLGDLPPMGMLWSFMGLSRSYTFFGGLAEVTGGLLLYFRKTTTLGALIVCAVMSNVVMLNFSYGVSVKLFSTQIFIWALFLVLPDGKRLADFFLLQRAVGAPLDEPWFASVRARKFAPLLQWAFIAHAVYTHTALAVDDTRKQGDQLPLHPLYGIYEVETFSIDGEERPPLFTDARRWRTMIVERDGEVVVRLMTDKRAGAKLDTDARTIAFHGGSPDNIVRYTQPSPDRLHLEGMIAGERVTIECKRADPATLPIMTGFRWIIE